MPTTTQAPTPQSPQLAEPSEPLRRSPTLHVVAARTPAASPIFLAALLDQTNPDDHLITLGPESLHRDARAVGWPARRLHPIGCPDAVPLTAFPALRKTLRQLAKDAPHTIAAHAWSPSVAKLTRLALPKTHAVQARLPHDLPPQPTPRRLPDTPTAQLCRDLRHRYRTHPDAPLVALLCDDPSHPSSRPLAQPLAVAVGIAAQARRAHHPDNPPLALLLHPLTPGLDAARRHATITGHPQPLIQEPRLAAPWSLLPALDTVILPPHDPDHPNPHSTAWTQALGTPTLTAPPLNNTFPRVLATQLLHLLDPTP
ncbi:MAG: hypothetical protein AAF750_15665 [Planctomycetota bacterium]